MSRKKGAPYILAHIVLSEESLYQLRQIDLKKSDVGIYEIPAGRSKLIALAIDELKHLIEYEIKNPGSIPFRNRLQNAEIKSSECTA